MRRQAGIVLGIFLIGTAWADTVSNGHYPLTIKVLSAQKEAVPIGTDANGVPQDCNLLDFSAYCHQSRSVIVRNTMLVQDRSGKSFTISCMADSRWSKCISLPVGETLGAQSEKNGFAIWYRNAKGKEVKQSYAIVSPAGKPAAMPSSQQNSPITNLENGGEVPAAPAIREGNRDAVKCNFTSTPSGAEITLDGRYVGNTPSTIGVGPGTYAVVLSMPGYAKWERAFTVSSGSDVSVSAALQKTQQ